MSWSDLAKEAGTELGKQAIRDAAARIRTSGDVTRDHIPAQNETGSKFAATLAAYNAGAISAAQARAEIQQWNSAFLLLTQQIGSSRALKGGAELNALAQRILQDLGGTDGGGVVIPPTGGGGGGGGGGVLVPGIGTISPTMLAIAGAAAVFLLMRKR